MDVLGELLRWLLPVFGNLSRLTPLVVLIAAVVMGGFAAYLVVREIMTHRSLRTSRRRRYLIRRVGPGDWPLEELERWAAQVSMIRRRVRRRFDRPAHAVRIRLEATPEGTRYTMEGSWRFERVMNNPALSGISVKKIRPAPKRGAGLTIPGPSQE